MIAKNYIRYPEALRFQVEMFSKGYKNQPRIMRLLEVICDWSPATPEWFAQARKRAKDLAAAVRKACKVLFSTDKNGKTRNDKGQFLKTIFNSEKGKT